MYGAGIYTAILQNESANKIEIMNKIERLLRVEAHVMKYNLIKTLFLYRYAFVRSGVLTTTCTVLYCTYYTVVRYGTYQSSLCSVFSE